MNAYTVRSKLGHGAFGDVYLCENINSDSVPNRKPVIALKTLSLAKYLESEKAMKLLRTEIQSHWDLNKCAGILKLQEIFIDPTNIFFVLEYQEGGTLLNKIED